MIMFILWLLVSSSNKIRFSILFELYRPVEIYWSIHFFYFDDGELEKMKCTIVYIIYYILDGTWDLSVDYNLI